jgi:hypothetical protein
MASNGSPRCKCAICGAAYAHRWALTIGPQRNYCSKHYDELAAVSDDPFVFEVRRRRLERTH